MRVPHSSPVRGFTIIEAMIATTVFAILLAVAAPSFTSMIVRNRLLTEANSLIGDLSLARSEAVRRTATVAVCSSTDGASCASSNDWSTGRIVFVDAAGDGSFNAGTDVLLRTYRETSSDSLTTSPGRSSLVFRADGTLAALTTFAVCHPGRTGWTVSLTTIGRPRLVAMTATC